MWRLVVERVAGEFDRLHPVQQRDRDRVEDVGGGDEEDLGEVELEVEVVVAEGVVLGRVEDLEHRRGGVAAEVGAHLVDLVDHEDRVAGAGVAQGADDRPRQGANVGAAVAADLRLVADPADRDPLELTPQRLGDRAPEAGLADPRRPDEAEDRAGRFGVEFAHREVLEDPVLDLLEVVVVGVEDLAGMADVEVVLGLLRPGQLDQPLEVGADDPVLGRRRWQLFQPRELALGGFAGVLGQVGRLDLLPQLVDFGLLLVALAELVLDRFHLLAQEELALALVDFGLDLRLDLAAELDHLELTGEDLGQMAEAGGDLVLLEQPLLLLGRDPQCPGDQIAERRGIVDVGDRQLQLFRQVWDLLDDLREGPLHVAGQCLELGAGVGLGVGQLVDSGDQVRLLGDVGPEPHPLRPLDQDPQRFVRHLHHPGDDADDADVVEVARAGLLVLGVTRGDHHQQPVGAEHVVDQLDRARLAHRERRDRVGEGDRFAQRQDRERVGQRGVGEDRVLGVERRLDHFQDRPSLHHLRPIGTCRVVSEGSRNGSSILSTPSS